MRIPEVRDALTDLARGLRHNASREYVADVIDALVQEMYRRKPVRPQQARRPGVKWALIREYAEEHEEDDYEDIATHFGVNVARVSEALRGKRQ